jgi:hypothetical protein
VIVVVDENEVTKTGTSGIIMIASQVGELKSLITTLGESITEIKLDIKSVEGNVVRLNDEVISLKADNSARDKISKSNFQETQAHIQEAMLTNSVENVKLSKKKLTVSILNLLTALSPYVIALIAIIIALKGGI